MTGFVANGLVALLCLLLVAAMVHRRGPLPWQATAVALMLLGLSYAVRGLAALAATIAGPAC